MSFLCSAKSNFLCQGHTILKILAERKVNKQVKYRIGDFASLVGVSTTTLRSWEKEGLLIPQERSEGNHRYYTDEQLDFVRKNGGKRFARGRPKEVIE